jgi:hypothetical protein
MLLIASFHPPKGLLYEAILGTNPQKHSIQITRVYTQGSHEGEWPEYRLQYSSSTTEL